VKFAVSAVIAMALASPVCAQDVVQGLKNFGKSQSDSEPVGEWKGKYLCGQGVTAVQITFDSGGKGLFHFFAAQENPNVPEGCFTVGTSISKAGVMTVRPTGWRVRPSNYVSVSFAGRFEDGGQRFEGHIRGLRGCGRISLVRGSFDRKPPAACL